GKGDGNKPDVEPLKSILKNNGVDVVITGVSMDSYFGPGNGSKQPEDGSKSDVDSGMNGVDRQHDDMHCP
ncbi:hypothetical protein Tco_1071702, partial [Tanacetum coccineum]